MDYAGINISNRLPYINTTVKAQLKVALRRHLNTQSFCSVNEFLVSQHDS